jgi:hypothetical protein
MRADRAISLHLQDFTAQARQHLVIIDKQD